MSIARTASATPAVVVRAQLRARAAITGLPRHLIAISAAERLRLSSLREVYQRGTLDGEGARRAFDGIAERVEVAKGLLQPPSPSHLTHRPRK
jgi:hypothetical protein